MKTIDCSLQLGPFNLELFFHYEGSVITDNEGGEDVDKVSLESIEINLYNEEDFIANLSYPDIASLNLDKANELLVQYAEQRAFEFYINDSINHTSAYEYYSDANDSYGEER